jgi:hypothetical protein
MDFILKHKLIVVVGIVALAGLVWWGLIGTTPQAPLLDTQDTANSSDQDIVSTLLTLRAVNLNGTIFSDPVYQSLKDFGKQIVPEPVGRENPFAPLEIQVTSDQTQSAQIFGAPTGPTNGVTRGNLNIFNNVPRTQVGSQ